MASTEWDEKQISAKAAEIRVVREGVGYSEEELDARYRLNGKKVKDLRDARHLNNDILSRLIKCEKRAFEYWIADAADGRRKSRPTGEQATLLAVILGASLSEITLPDEDENVEEDLPGSVPPRARMGVLREYWSMLGWYRRHLGRRWIVAGHQIHEFRNHGATRGYYAEVVVRPDVWPTLEPIMFTFAFRTPGMREGLFHPVRRIDFGEVELHPDGDVGLASTFQSQDSRGLCDRRGAFKVWTWFGDDPADFQVRSTTRFGIEMHLEDAGRDPGRAPTDVVCFAAAPHHRRRG